VDDDRIELPALKGFQPMDANRTASCRTRIRISVPATGSDSFE
jgi:hypothetical protein